MGDWRNAALQAAFWTYANSLRLEAKLCDIVLYVQGRKGAMVGYPAHKLLLISASKYFKLLFEREDLRNFCHFPHLSEDGLFTVLDIVYGREISDSVNLDDALMAARFLQVDCAVEELEAKRIALEAKARASPKAKSQTSSGAVQTGMKRKVEQSPQHHGEGHGSRESDGHRSKHIRESPANPPQEMVEMRLFKNIKTDTGNDNTNDSEDRLGGEQSQDSGPSPSDATGANDQESQDTFTVIKTEPDVDLTIDDENNEQGMQHLGYDQGGSFSGQAYGHMQMDNVSGQNESGLMFGDGQFNADSYSMGDVNFGTYSGSGDMPMHHPDNKLRCDICGKVFATVGHLEEHRNTHTDDVTEHSDRDSNPVPKTSILTRDASMLSISAFRSPAEPSFSYVMSAINDLNRKIGTLKCLVNGSFTEPNPYQDLSEMPPPPPPTSEPSCPATPSLPAPQAVPAKASSTTSSLSPTPAIHLNYGVPKTNPRDLDRNDLDALKMRATSINNFAAKLVEVIFPRDVRQESNTRGVRGKRALDSSMMAKIKMVTMELYSVNDVCADAVWKGCVKAIDESCRRLNRNRVGLP